MTNNNYKHRTLQDIYRYIMYITQRGFIIYKGVGVRFADFISFYLIFPKYSMKKKLFGLTETQLFHFHRTFKNGGGGFERIPETPLDPPLLDHLNQKDLF